MLLISILIHAMMQQFTVAEGGDCSKISCIIDCPVNIKQINRDDTSQGLKFNLESSTLGDSTVKELHSNQHDIVANSLQMQICCSIECSNHCVTEERNIVAEGTEWQNVHNPCITHFCSKGVISNHSSLCSPIPCPPTHHTLAPGECCPVCDSNWASFCAEDYDCDIACQHGFIVDRHRGCDLCKCARKTEPSMSKPAIKAIETSPNNDATPHSIRFYFYLDPTDGATKTLVIGITVLFFGVLVALVTAVGCYFHKRVYKKVPLLSLGNSTA